MSMAAPRLILGLLGMLMWLPSPGIASETAVEPLQGKEWQSLAMVTGFHALANRQLGFAMRVLEADGSASIAENPVALFVVVTNQGTSDLEERIWRLPVRVATVRKVRASQCGLEIDAEMEGEAESGTPGKKSLATIKACFLNEKGKLRSTLRLEVGESHRGSGEGGTRGSQKTIQEH